MKLAPRGGEALQRAPFPMPLGSIVQMICSTRVLQKDCSRGICRRTRTCMPPRHKWEPTLFRCPFDDKQQWEHRRIVVGLLSERLKKLYEEAQAARGLPSLFAPPVVD